MPYKGEDNGVNFFETPAGSSTRMTTNAEPSGGFFWAAHGYAAPPPWPRLEHFNFQIVYKYVRLAFMRTASKEIRLIALRAYESGIPRQQVADIVGYHLNS
ncbi:MAG: hypothetical protein AB7D07_17250, partial [Desulfovibrionaceae bacterium]